MSVPGMAGRDGSFASTGLSGLRPPGIDPNVSGNDGIEMVTHGTQAPVVPSVLSLLLLEPDATRCGLALGFAGCPRKGSSAANELSKPAQLVCQQRPPRRPLAGLKTELLHTRKVLRGQGDSRCTW